MNQKHLFRKSFFCLLLIAVIFVVGCGGSSSPPKTTAVIDLSHSSTEGFGFGNGPADNVETKRWQTFTANSHPVITEVELKLKKYGSGGTYTPVLVELYNTSADGKPTPGARLAYGLIPPTWIGTGSTVVKTGLHYNGLVAGKQYAIVLTQGVRSSSHYQWCTKPPISPGLHFGKYENNIWVDESHFGGGWLKVYVASQISPPTRIIMYLATTHNGDLRGSYFDARTGADFIAADRPLSLAGKTTHAFISISSTDSIANMPARFGFPSNIPIVGVMGDTKIIADNWGDLLDGSIKINLKDALGMPTNDSWWSGSNADGTYDVSYNCNGWTSTGSDGMAGIENVVDNRWIHFLNGSGPFWVLGIAY